MTRFVIDPPTLLQLASSDNSRNASHQLVAPNAVRSQALDVLLQRVHNGELTDQAALALHERLTEMKMRLLGDRVSRRTAWWIARECGWDSLRDAEYLAVTTLQADALVTIDADLAEKAEGVVPLAKLEDLYSE